MRLIALALACGACATSACPEPSGAERAAPARSAVTASDRPEADGSETPRARGASTAPAVPVAVGFRSAALATRFWWIDQASRWSDAHTQPEHLTAMEAAAALTPPERAALTAYAAMRARHSGSPSGDDAPRLDALPPRLDVHERFAEAFVAATDLDAALGRLALPPADAAVIRNAFARLGPRIDKRHAARDSLEVAQGQLAEAAERAKLAQFVGRVARFYGVGAVVEGPLDAVLVPAPEGRLRATALGRTLVLPVPPGFTRSPQDRAELLGVVAHEAGHYLLSLASDEARRRVTREIDGRLGLPNLRRANVLDEAMQTALGNLVFMRRAFPEYSGEQRPLYAYDPSADHPYAVDALARALAPHIEALLDVEDVFSREFLRIAARAHQDLFSPSLRHHTRVLSLLAEDEDATSLFTGLFAAKSRARYGGDDIARFFAETRDGNAPRFTVGTRRWLAAERAQFKEHEALLASALGSLVRGKVACTVARFSPERGAFDVLVVGEDHSALRRMLVAIHRGLSTPAGRAACL